MYFYSLSLDLYLESCQISLPRCHLVGEAKTRDVKAYFIYCTKNADKRGKSRRIVY